LRIVLRTSHIIGRCFGPALEDGAVHGSQTKTVKTFCGLSFRGNILFRFFKYFRQNFRLPHKLNGKTSHFSKILPLTCDESMQVLRLFFLSNIL